MAQLGLFGETPAQPAKPEGAGPPANTAADAPPPALAENAAGPATAPPPAAAPAAMGPSRPPIPRKPIDVEKTPFSIEKLSKELNGPQLDAATAPGQPLLVVAGAGSGSTRVSTYRIARLIAGGSDPRRILSVTFTNKAAGEMRERVSHLLWERLRVSAGGRWRGTFHALSARLLRQWGTHSGRKKVCVVYVDDEQMRLLARVLTDLAVPERLFPVRQVLSAIDRQKNQGVGAADYHPSDYFDDVVAKAYRLYEERLRAANATDFGGLLLNALRLCEEPTPAREEIFERFDHVLVDEFQDTNAVQYRLVRHLSRRTHSITVVGDEDQSIYGWRGADIRNILDFERDHDGARVVKLEQNYRSTGHILRAANTIIARNTERRPKKLFTTAGDGELIVMFEGETERDEADFVAGRIATGLQADMSPRDFAVFYRTNAQSRALEDALRARDIPYIVVGGTRFFDRAEIKNLIAYLRGLINPDDEMALQRKINVPARGIDDATVERVSAYANERHLSFWDALEDAARSEALLGAGPRKKVGAFVALMQRLRGDAGRLGPAGLAEKVMEVSSYRDALASESTMEAEGRLENLMELIAQMREYEKEAEDPTLSGFLERVALVSDVDGYDADKGAVSLMTVHTAKGLEFPTVFITGMEEWIFPHARSVDDDSAVEEERRLCYVAVTRARKNLLLSRVRRRRLSGQELPGIPSRFLSELPGAAMDMLVMERPAGYGYGDTEGQGPWGGKWSRDDNQSDRYGTSAYGRGRAPAKPSPPPRSRAEGGELHVDYDAGSSDEGGQVVGMKLAHPQFGVGEVRGWQGAGNDLKVTVRYPQAGVKTILARFLTQPA